MLDEGGGEVYRMVVARRRRSGAGFCFLAMRLAISVSHRRTLVRADANNRLALSANPPL